jgi:alpha-glucosidase
MSPTRVEKRETARTTGHQENAIPWWREAVIYQIYPRSFADSNGDGVGDLPGVLDRLDHLSALGVDALWLSPFYRSPMADAGYDISDHEDVDPVFGTLEDADRLIAAVHERGMRVLLDFVPNHTSDKHPWFEASRSSRDDPHRGWYIWRDEPNDWRAALAGGSTWTWDEKTEQFYLHLFLAEQPDLNWHHPDVVDAMHGVMQFWMERGVDGFRLDAVQCLGKDPAFADDPRCLAGEPLSSFNDQPFTHDVLRGIRRMIDETDGDHVLLGEVDIRSLESIVEYYGTGDELHMSFNFSPLDAPWDPLVFATCVEEVETLLAPAEAWPTWVLSNHDNRRERTRYGGSLRRARAAAVLLLTLRGTPFIYQGQELGLEDAEITDDNRVDPGGRDGARAPLPWTSEPDHGWHGAEPWLPFPPDSADLSAERQLADEGSTFHLFRRLIAARKASPALLRGTWTPVDSPPEVFAYRRETADDTRLIAINFADSPQELSVEGEWTVDISSDGHADGEQFSGTIDTDEGVLLRPGRP